MDTSTIPIPVGPDGQPAFACVMMDPAGGWQIAWMAGTSKSPAGLHFDTVRAACRTAIGLNERMG